MKRRNFISHIGTGTLAGAAAMPLIVTGCTTPSDDSMPREAIQHMVIFDLKHEKESEDAQKFLTDGKMILGAIPGVEDFQAFEQVSPKNDFSYGFSMIFADQDAYQSYNDHPDHVAFVENRWQQEVTRFLEIDFQTF